MCGFTITKESIPNVISHRGTEVNSLNKKDWFICFNSLPISSNNTGLKQPLQLDNYELVFNGEIFNYKELNNKSRSDLHYIADLFKSCKNDIEKFYKESIKWEGFWAISILNPNGDLYSFTDPLGKKQLYYSSNGVSSEIKPLLLGSDYIYMEYDQFSYGKNQTNFSNVSRFIPGNLYCYKKDTRMPYLVLSQKYFTDTTDQNIYYIIDKAVNERLENRIDGISILLSAGLDSNIILHHLLKQTKDIDVVSYESDESEMVKDICDANGLEVTFVKPDESFFDKAVHAYEHSLDFGSLLPNYLLFKNCKNRIVLTGDGSDELFSGYARSLIMDTWKDDVFKELPYYHNIRIDRTSMIHTREARSPLMSNRLVNVSKRIKWNDRVGKKVLREIYLPYLPDFVINGDKKPLRHNKDKGYNYNLVKEKHESIWLNH